MWRKLLTHLVSDFLAHDRSQLFWQSGLRNAIGIVLPLLLGVLTGHIQTAVVVAVGGIVTGFAGLSGTWQRRLRVMSWAMVWIAVAAFVGVATGRLLWVSLVFTALSGGLAGMFVAVSPEFAQIGTLATNALIIFSGLSLTPSTALGLAVKVMAGGALQLLLMLAVVPWQPQADGTNSLKHVLASLAYFCLNPSRDTDLTTAQALVVAETRVSDRAIKREQRRKLLDLLYAVDLVRNDVVALRSLSRMAAKPQNFDQKTWNELFAAIAQELAALRKQLSMARPARRADPEGPPEAAQEFQELRAYQSRLEDGPAEAHERIDHLIETLDHMHAVIYGGTPYAAAIPEPSTVALPSPGQILANMRANFTMASATFRHGLRIMGTLGVAVWLYHAVSLPRGYWVPLTAMVVLKADFFSTVGRGLARVAGTLIGVAAGTGVVLAAVSGNNTVWGLASVVAFAWVMYSVLNYNYTLFSVMVSAEIVILLSYFERIVPLVAMQDRLLDTLIGSGLALVAYGVLPTWQRSQVPVELAKLLGAERRYLQAILTGTSPWISRRETRLMRTHAATVIDAALSEPSPHFFARDMAARFLSSLHTLAEVLMGLEFTSDRKPLHDNHAFVAFCQQFDARLEGIEASMRMTGLEQPSEPHQDVALDADPINDAHLRYVAQQLGQVAHEMSASLPL